MAGTTSRSRGWVFGRFGRSGIRAVTAVGRSLVAAVVMVVVLTALCLAPILVGLYLFPPVADWLASLGMRARRAFGLDGPAAYPAPGRRGSDHGGSLRGLFDRVVGDVGESGFWRIVLWALLDLVVVWVTAMLPLLFVVYGLAGAFVQPFVWRVIVRAGGNNWYAFVHVTDQSAALAAIPVGLVLIAIGLVLVPVTDRAYTGWLRVTLSPTRGQLLAARNRDLTTSRADVVDDREAGLSRIQRDLHDGAQARLVAMGMSLDQAVRALDADPHRARLLLGEAQQLSTSALAELRDLVHGIHSPVLADRGLGDAIRSLVLDTGFDADVVVDLPSRPAPPIEAAVYYAISELVTNAAKHSQASTMSITVVHRDHELTAVVRDDGIGGADDTGRGLTGITRRLAAFDGSLRIDSPRGGPTAVTVLVPCTLS